MRQLMAAGLAAILVAGCGGPQGSPQRPQGQHRETGNETADPPPRLEGASCKGKGGGSAENTPDFVGVDVASQGGVDRVTFRFRPQAGSTSPPSHYVRFSDQPLSEEEGDPAHVAGKAFVVVVFGASGVDLSGDQPVDIYKGPTEFKPALGTVVEGEELGDFEATITWAIGLSRRACFRVEAEADGLMIEFPSA